MSHAEPAPQPAHGGSGELFSSPDCEAIRDAMRSRPRGMVNKLTTVPEAVQRLLSDGEYLAIGGFGGDRIPTAAVHEIVRQQRQRLSFAGHTATHDFQILCAGNLTGRGKLLEKVDIAYVVGLEARGLSPHSRRVIESGEVATTEWSNYALATRFRAAAMGVPFLPVRVMLGTDTFNRSAARIVTCPFTGQQLAALPALSPDVAIIHVHEADRYGNCRIRGTTVADFDLARAAKKVIITCERLIDEEEIRRDPSQTIIPYYCVDAVCEVPFGSYPANMPYEYFSDEQHLKAWLLAERDLDTFQEFLNKHIFGVGDFHDYLAICGGTRRLQELRREEMFPAG